MKRVALYARGSSGGQAAEVQLRELNEVAARQGWRVIEEFVEPPAVAAGIGRTKGERAALERLVAAASRREVDLVAAWSLDRLGRSVPELMSLLCQLRSRQIDLYLHRPGVDTCTPAGRALYELLDVFGECEQALAVEGIVNGLAETWTVRGVSLETREAVREAAARQHLPVGAWMDRVLWQAAEAALRPSPPPASQADVERIVQRLLDERLQPLAHKLERLEPH